MPKKKPAGSRAHDFDPRYAAKKPGSRSPKHRGYREEEPTGKRRWTAQEKAGRGQARPIRGRADHATEGRAGYRGDDRRVGDARRGDARTGSWDRSARPGEDRRRSDRYREDGRRDGYRSGRPHERAQSDRTRQGRDFREGGERNRDFREGGERNRDFRGDRPRTERRGDWSRDDRRPERSDRRPAREERGGYDRPRAERGGYDRPRTEGQDRRRDAGAPKHHAHRPSERPEQNVQEDVVHERLGAQTVAPDAGSGTSFADLGMGQNIVRALADLGAPSPFPIQAAVIPPLLEGRDVLGRGRTGSGKTIAFGAPLVESLLRARAGAPREFGRRPQAIILAPTRELALQIDRTVQPIARSVGLFTTQIYGGVPQARQVGALKKGVDIIIGTPGRIEDLQEQGKLDLSGIRIAVLDEADHMSELGFLEPMQRILRLVPADAQKILMSATLDREVEALVDEFLTDPAVYEVAGETQETGTISHRVLLIDHRNKAEILNSLVDRDGKTLVFTRTRAYAEMLAEQFQDEGIPAVALHGDLNQAKRTRNLQRMTDGKVRILVATDVAARGIHVDDIDLVIQADAPDEYKTYLHRSGRTGRAGREGTVVTIVSRNRTRKIRELLDRAEIEAPFDDAVPGADILEEVSGRQVSDPAA